MSAKSSISKNKALLTAIGFMVGSGIFFRADNIIGATKGNVIIAILSWVLMSSTLIFAGISIAGIASQKNIKGGFIGYIGHYFTEWFGEKVGKNLEFIIGWYQVVVYAPILIAIVSIVFAGYFCQVFGIDSSGMTQYIIALILVIAMYIWNKISTKIAATISATATAIKVIPLIVIAIAGMIFGEPSSLSSTVLPRFASENTSSLALLFAPMLSIAFAFDGWVSVGALSEDLENPKKNLPGVFTWSVIITAIIYIAYFTGVSSLMSASDILESGDLHVGIIARNLFGQTGEKLVLVGVLISVLGTANAIFMAGTRYVHKLAEEDLLIGSKNMKIISKEGTPANASNFILVGTIIYIALYYIQSTNTVAVLNGITIDDIPMVLNSIFYLFLFFISFRLYKEKVIGSFQGVVSPIVAAIGQLFIVGAFFLANDKALLYLVISFVVIILGFINKMKK